MKLACFWHTPSIFLRQTQFDRYLIDHDQSTPHVHKLRPSFLAAMVKSLGLSASQALLRGRKGLCQAPIILARSAAVDLGRGALPGHPEGPGSGTSWRWGGKKWQVVG